VPSKNPRRISKAKKTSTLLADVTGATEGTAIIMVTLVIMAADRIGKTTNYPNSNMTPLRNAAAQRVKREPVIHDM
jgi:hypothetical protein